MASDSTRLDAAARLHETLRASGLVDTHYHVGPELLPRRYNVATLAAAAAGWNATLVLKNHTYPTTPLASLARAEYGVRFVGSVVLNRFVGGLNADAVLGAHSGNRSNVSDTPQTTTEPPFVVWMPTVHAASHLRTLGHAFDPRWSGCCNHQDDNQAVPSDNAVTTSLVSTHNEQAALNEQPVVAFDEALRPRAELLHVLEAVARTRSTLATGHLAADEIVRLVPLALDYGVRSVIITHPHYPSVRLSDEQLRFLSRDPRVFVEHCMAVHTIEEVPLEQIAASIRATGPEQVVVASDFGQIHSEPFPDGTLTYASRLEQLLVSDVSRADFVAMYSCNGARALGL